MECRQGHLGTVQESYYVRKLVKKNYYVFTMNLFYCQIYFEPTFRNKICCVRIEKKVMKRTICGAIRIMNNTISKYIKIPLYKEYPRGYLKHVNLYADSSRCCKLYASKDLTVFPVIV